MKAAAGYNRSVVQDVAGLLTVIHLGFSTSMLSFLRRKILLLYLLKIFIAVDKYDKIVPEARERSCESPFPAALAGFQTCLARLRDA